jgi:superfamily II DNA/RNA helicase
MGQEQRERSMAAFKAGKRDVLVATDVAARGIDVDDVTHVINHTIPDEEKTYLHRAGRTGRAGKTGIAVTFVDWEDLHKWALINRALEFGQPEPVETYSSSPHLFEDLDIPAGTKGRLVTAPKAEKPASERRQRQPQKAADAAAEGSDEGTTRRRRRRRRGSGEDKVGLTFAEGSEQPASGHSDSNDTADREADGAGTHDGDATREHRDGKPAPQRRRRRRRSGGAAPSGA